MILLCDGPCPGQYASEGTASGCVQVLCQNEMRAFFNYLEIYFEIYGSISMLYEKEYQD